MEKLQSALVFQTGELWAKPLGPNGAKMRVVKVFTSVLLGWRIVSITTADVVGKTDIGAR